MAKEERLPQKNKLDNKFATYTFMAIVFCVILCGLLVGSLAESTGADLNNFWESSVVSVIQYGVFLALFFILSRQLKLKGREISRAVDLKPRLSGWNLLLVVILAGLTLTSFILLTQGVSDIMVRLGYTPADSIDPSGMPQYIMSVIVLCVLPAIIEELLFRGFILKGLLPLGRITAVVASALLFSLFHFNPDQTFFQFILGIVLAAVVLKTGNLLYGMILHFLNNFAVITTYTFWGGYLDLLAWTPKVIVIAVGLAVLGTLLIIGCMKALKPHDEPQRVQKAVKFWSFDNIGFFIATALGGCVWIITLIA